MIKIIVSILSLVSVSFSKEYGVFLLPNVKGEKTVKSLIDGIAKHFKGKNINYNDVKNTPHVSIFQGVFGDKVLESLKAGVQTLASKTSPISVSLHPKLEDIQVNIFLNFKDNSPIAQLSDMFYGIDLHKLRDKGTLMRQVDDMVKEGISEDTSKLIKKYGVSWNTPGNYNPHFTLIYGSGKNDKIADVLKGMHIPNESIMFDKIGIGRLGYDGNVEEIICTFSGSSAFLVKGFSGHIFYSH